MQERRGLDVKQRAVADLALVHLAVLLQALDDQRVEGGDLIRQLTGVKFLPPGLESTEDRRSQQAADVLAHAEQHREADQVARIGEYPANTGEHRRRQKKGAAEAKQKLAEHQLFRAGEGVGLTVEQRGHHDQRQGGGGRPVELLRVKRQAAGNDPAQNAGEN